MVIVDITYKKPLSEVDRYLSAHRDFLDQYYRAGKLICNGRKKGRVGGIVLMSAGSEGEAEKIFAEDPFQIHGIAEYRIIEFYPTRFAEEFGSWMNEE